MYADVCRDSSFLKDFNHSFIRSVDGTIPEAQMQAIEPALRTPVLEASETCGMVSASKEIDFRPGACGQAVNGFESIILDATGMAVSKAVSPTTVGKIAVRGVHICKEYVGNDAANKERFVEIANGDSSNRYFLTGDEGLLSRWLTWPEKSRGREKA